MNNEKMISKLKVISRISVVGVIAYIALMAYRYLPDVISGFMDGWNSYDGGEAAADEMPVWKILTLRYRLCSNSDNHYRCRTSAAFQSQQGQFTFQRKGKQVHQKSGSQLYRVRDSKNVPHVRHPRHRTHRYAVAGRTCFMCILADIPLRNYITAGIR